jgi:Uma2 family endonuclease
VSPQGQHSALQAAVLELFNSFARQRRLARAFPELRTIYGGAAYVPDVSVYRWERIPRTPDGKVANRFTEPPDIAIEIVSPEQSVNALVRRCVWYVQHGVQVAVLVDPADESVLIFRADTTPLAVRGDDAIDVTDAVPGLQLTVSQVFSALRMS